MRRTIFSVLTLATVLSLLAGCGNAQMESYLEQTEELAVRFADTIELASSTPRASLSAVVSDMQEIYRETENLEVPEEAQKNHEELLEWMKAATDGFMAFLSQEDDDLVAAYFERATGAFKDYMETREELLE